MPFSTDQPDNTEQVLRIMANVNAQIRTIRSLGATVRLRITYLHGSNVLTLQPESTPLANRDRLAHILERGAREALTPIDEDSFSFASPLAADEFAITGGFE